MSGREARFLIGMIAVLVGCRAPHSMRDAEYAATSRALNQAFCGPSIEASDTFVDDASYLEGAHPVEEYIWFALQQNPDIHAARKRMESFAHQVPVAASLQDPMLNVTVLPEQVQTAAGQQDLIVGVNQQLPWIGKLDARANVAEAQTNVARAHLATVELETISKVKRAYYELYFVQRAITATEQEQRLLNDIRDVAYTRYQSGKASQQDVLRAELEISNVANDLIGLRQQLRSGQARLARLLHIAPTAQLLALEDLPSEEVPANLDVLQAEAIRARPELHAKFAEIERDRLSVDLANLQYKPDLTFGLSWMDIADAGLSPISNGRDAFLLSVGGNLPVYRQRLDSAVRSAEAKAVSTAREYDSLRDGTLEEVTDLFVKARSQQEMLDLFEADILPKARQTLEVSRQAYNVDRVDFLQLVDNWRQVLRYEIMYRRQEANLRQTLADLERVVGGMASVRGV